jgi:hypothetical protein
MKMISKSVYLAAVAAIALAMCVSTFGQGDQVLVGGKAPLRVSQVNAVVEFYEWAFDTTFTAAERSRFEELTTEYHKQDPERSAKETETIVKALALVKSKDAATQAEFRKDFTKDFVADLRKSDNAASQLLLPIYERTRQKATAPTSSSNAKAGSTGGAIVGRWTRYGGAGGMRDYTGKTQYNDSDDVTFEFGADGSVRFLNEKKTLSITQCKMSETIDLPGRYTISGGTVTMVFATGKHDSTSTCDSKRNFNKTVPGDTVSKQFVVKNYNSVFRPDAPLILCMDGSADDKCFEKVKSR